MNAPLTMEGPLAEKVSLELVKTQFLTHPSGVLRYVILNSKYSAGTQASCRCVVATMMALEIFACSIWGRRNQSQISWTSARNDCLF